MRELIKTEKLQGKIFVNDKCVCENVFGEYQYDVYSNKNMKGTLNGHSESCNFNKLFEADEFVFIGNGLTIKGSVEFWDFLNNDNCEISIDELTYKFMYNNGLPSKIRIRFYIPYISVLARNLKHRYTDDKQIVNFNSESFKLDVKDLTIIFSEKINITKYKDPDLILNRQLYPQIEISIDNLDQLSEKINNSVKIFEDIMIIISFLLFKRLISFGYRAEIFDESDEVLQSETYKSSLKKSGEDYIKDNGFFFNKFFTSENISKLVDSLINLENSTKEKYLRVFYAYMTIGELKIFQPQFKDSYFALEAISKLIVQPKRFVSSEDLIVDACNQADIDISKIKFKPAIMSEKLRWLISEYRNELTHFNFDTHFEMNELVKEFSKIMKLLRMLIIYFLVPELKDFPYPKDKYKF